MNSTIDGRRISGKILPWNEPGATSGGQLTFTAKAVRVPKDLSRVKLLFGHSPDGQPVGVLESLDNREDGLYATFTIGNTALGEQAITEAKEKIRDSFSVEMSNVGRQGAQVLDSVLKAVALVPFPAFKSAQIKEVCAENATPSHTIDMEYITAEEAAMTENENTTALDPSAETAEPTKQETSDTAAPVLAPAAAPAGLHVATSTAPAPEVVTASEAANILMAARHGDEVHAKLHDITNTDMLNAAPAAWLGHLWDGVNYSRRLVPLVNNQVLKSWKAQGYRWTTKPTVATYAGDKAEIPTNSPAIEAVEVTADRWAGGHDIDRKFFDFKDGEFLAAYWQAMAESYAYETDKALGQFLATNATQIDEKQPDIIRAAAYAAMKIDQDIHSPATFVVVNPEDFTKILDLSQLDAPHFLGMVPMGSPSKWVTSEFVSKGEVLVGAKSAVTHFELGGSPLRTRAENIAHGGYDAALFGYTAHLLTKAEGLRKIKFGSE